MGFSYEFPRPAIAVDCVVFGLDSGSAGSTGSGQLMVLCVKRGLPPGGWALPGGFVHVDESLDDAARRELREESGVHITYLEQLRAFGEVDRDPRERVISIAYFALVDPRGYVLSASTDAEGVSWFRVADLPSLAFDHATIVDVAWKELRKKVRRNPIGFDLLPKAFSLTQLQRMYEAILGRALDKRNFRKKIHATGLLESTEQHETNVGRRPAELFRFDRAAYAKLDEKGFDLELV